MKPHYLLSKRRNEVSVTKIKMEKLNQRKALELTVMPTMEDVEYARKDSALAKIIGETFVNIYPGHGWQVESDIRQGIAKIYNCHVSGKFGWLMHTKDLDMSKLRRTVMRIGGEMLERSGMKAEKLNNDDVLIMQLIPEHKRVDLS